MQQPSESRQRPSKADDRPDGDPERPLPGTWRKLLGRAPGERRPAGAETLGFFFELINDPDTPAARLEVAPVLLGVLDKGRLGRAVPVDAEQLTRTPLSQADQRLACCVLGLPHVQRKNRSYAHLSGRIGDLLLGEILDTAPCFIGGVAGLRLARGKGRALHWTWQLQDDGSQRLMPDLAPGHHLIRVGGLWYLDAENAQLCPLDGPAEEAVLLEAPALAPEDSAAMATALPQSRWAERVPAPRVFDSIRHPDLAPQPVLTLHAINPAARSESDTREGAAREVAYACLGFDYGGERLSGRGEDSVVRRIHRGALVEIQRRRAEELASMERLEGAGLTPAVDTEGLPWDLAKSLPEDAWLFPGKGHTGALEVNTWSRWLALRPRLEDEGFQLAYAPSFPFEVLEGEVQWYGSASDTASHEGFDLEVGIEVDGRRIDLLPMVARALHEHQISLEPGPNENEDAVWYAPVDERHRVPLKLQELRHVLEPLADYLEHAPKHMRLPRVQAGRLDELAHALPAEERLDAPAALRDFTRRLREAAGRASAKVPASLNAELRGYQRDGLHWLDALAEAGVGGVLADDMGLGKTLQVLAHVLALKARGDLPHPALVVAPTSLLPNWQSETARFAPDLRVLVLHGAQRADLFGQIASHDLVLTSYALLPRDVDALKEHPFSVAVIDEAQQVKNPRTQARRALLALDAPRRICLSGTPLENHLGELWSQIDLAVPGLLGDETSFRRHYRVPIEKQRDEVAQQRLNRRIAPFILRRTKAEVASELPPKTEIARRVVLEGRQRELYESLRLSLADELREVIDKRGIEHSGIAVLDALLKLRQVCCDPRLVKLESARQVHESAKFELLMDMLPSLVAEGRRVLVFSQFTDMLRLIAEALDAQKLSYVTLTGETRDRAEPVRRFQDGEVPLFLLSLKAGGVGLNLTAADTVIHYDPWWNPAAEAQASDRAHRIGQDKPVFVYRLITADTVEERIEAMKVRKAELAEAVLEGGGTRDKLTFDQDDLDALLAPL